MALPPPLRHCRLEYSSSSVLVPLAAARFKYGDHYAHSVSVTLGSIEYSEQALSEIRALSMLTQEPQAEDASTERASDGARPSLRRRPVLLVV